MTQAFFRSWSLAAATTALLVTQLFHSILLFPIQAVGTATWLAILIAGVLACTLFWPVARMLRRVPGGHLIGLARRAAGVPGAIGTGTVVAGLTVYHGGFILRETAEMAVGAVYPHTPQTFAVVALILCALFGAWGGAESLVRIGWFFLPILGLAIVLALGGSVGWGEYRYLLPLWGEGKGMVIRYGVELIWMYAAPALFMFVAAGRLLDRARLGLAGITAIGSASLLFAVTAVVLLMTIPLPLGHSIAFPLYYLTRLVAGGRFFGRLDGVWMCIWVFGTAGYLAAWLYTGAAAYARAFRIPTHRTLVLPLGALITTVALFPPDQGRTLAWHSMVAPYAGAVAFGIPLILTLLAWWRLRWKRG